MGGSKGKYSFLGLQKLLRYIRVCVKLGSPNAAFSWFPLPILREFPQTSIDALVSLGKLTDLSSPLEDSIPYQRGSLALSRTAKRRSFVELDPPLGKLKWSPGVPAM